MLINQKQLQNQNEEAEEVVEKAAVQALAGSEEGRNKVIVAVAGLGEVKKPRTLVSFISEEAYMGQDHIKFIISMLFGVCTVVLLIGYGGKKKSKTKSTLKKAAVIGATAYGAYQLGKLSGRFSSPGYGYGNRGYGYQQWNSWREVDGFLCRKAEDCNGIDPRLYCQDYELKFTPQVSLL